MFFDGCSENELAKLEKLGTLRKYMAGDIVLKEGEGGTSFGVLLEGRVEVRKLVEGDTYKALVELKEFDLVGELGFFGAAVTRTASVVALDETQMLEFDRPGFQRFTESNSEIGCKVYRNMALILAERLTNNDSTLMDTIIWALGQPRDAAPRPGGGLQSAPKLKMVKE